MPASGNNMSGAPNFKDATFRFVDARGDRSAVALRVPVATTTAQISAIRTALGNATNANLYEVWVTEVYGGLPLASVALDQVFPNTDSVVNILFKNITTLESSPFEIPAPAGGMIISGESVDTEDPLFVAVSEAVQDALGDVAWVAYTARFTERKNVNKAVQVVQP